MFTVLNLKDFDEVISWSWMGTSSWATPTNTAFKFEQCDQNLYLK